MSATAVGRLTALRIEQDRAVKSDTKTMTAEEKKVHAERTKLAESSRTDALGTIAAFIPSEALTVYIAGLAVVSTTQDLKDGPAIWVVVVVAAVLAILVNVRSSIKVTPGKTLVSSWKFWLQLLITELAFGLYVLTIPGTPFPVALGWAGLLVVLAAPLFAVVADLAGLTPTKPATD